MPLARAADRRVGRPEWVKRLARGGFRQGVLADSPAVRRDLNDMIPGLQEWRSDSVLVSGDTWRRYILVAMALDPRGDPAGAGPGARHAPAAGGAGGAVIGPVEPAGHRGSSRVSMPA
jgi:hypothetical protein